MEGTPANHTNLNYRFLEDGGEMGELIRAFDWSTSPLGPIETWSQSLTTTLGIQLHSGFPMFLFWGPEFICFYNDAFRPSLGIEGKHPAIGKPGKEVWAEIWDFVGPMIEGVYKTGRAVYFEDQPIGFYRNGRMEDIYWTFSYSPAYADNGQISGVFVTCFETTKTVETIRRLGESEQRFRKLAEDTDILIAMSDDTGNARFFNKAWEHLTGRSEKELLDYGWLDLIHPEDRDRIYKTHIDAFNKKQPWSDECRIFDRKGEIRWLLVKSSTRSAADGSFAGHISSTIDTTESKLSAKRFRESEHRLREIIESAPFPIGVYAGREMRIEIVNQAIMDVWGKGSDIVGKTYFEVLPELEMQSIYPQLDNVYTTGQPFHARNQRVDLAIHGKLQTFYFNYSFTPLYDTRGEIYGVMNTAADVTDIHLVKQKLEQSEENLRNMVRQAPVAMSILLGPEHVIEVANDLIINLWGKGREAVMNKPVFEALPDARNQGLEEVINEVYKTGISFTASERPVTLLRNGKLETLFLNFVYDPYKDSDGNILGVLAIAIDVTSQVHARQKIEEIVADRTRELAVANQNLAKSNSELAQFAYIASHDLQEPLRKIRTFTQMLEKNIADKITDADRNYFAKIQNSSARMHALIKDVLAYSELDTKVLFTDVDLNETLENVIADFELLIEQKGAVIRADKLPTVKAVPLQMSQLFGNLISNALKFVRTDIKPEIRISCQEVTAVNNEESRNKKFYRIRVSDNGIGFKQEFAEQIFNIFQRLHRKSEFEGTGIGLAMCKKIAQNHNGHMDADGSSENGAVFNIYLPVS